MKISDKNWRTTVTLFHLLGVFGVHRFYVGKIGTGALYLLAGLAYVINYLTGSIIFTSRAIWTSIPVLSVIYLMDIIKLYSGNFTDSDGAIVLPPYKKLLIDTIRQTPFANHLINTALDTISEEQRNQASKQNAVMSTVPEGKINLVRLDSTDAEVLTANDYVVFDTETTGLSPNTDKVIELSLLKVSGGKIVDEYCTLVNPEMHIPSRSTKIHGIRDDDVKDAPHYDEVGAQMVEFLGNCLIVGHNVKFDLGFLGGLLKNVVLPEDLTWRYVDTIPMAKAAYPGMENYKLQTLVSKLGIETEGAHRAHADTLATRKLFELCRARLEQ